MLLPVDAALSPPPPPAPTGSENSSGPVGGGGGGGGGAATPAGGSAGLEVTVGSELIFCRASTAVNLLLLFHANP
jgi:hypothetical protein